MISLSFLSSLIGVSKPSGVPYEIPEKLLDSPEVSVGWPEQGFTESGRVLRLDYTSDLHLDDTWVPFSHEFHTDVAVHEARMLEEEPVSEHVRPSIDPIFLGFADRIFFRVEDTTIGIYSGELPEGCPSADYVEEMPPNTLLLWDPDANQLLLADEGLNPWLVLRDGQLWLDESAMIGG